VPEIAERAGVGAGTIYRHFASKEAVVNELYRLHKQALTRAGARDFPVGAAAREQFARCGTGWRATPSTSRAASRSSSCTTTARTSTPRAARSRPHPRLRHRVPHRRSRRARSRPPTRLLIGIVMGAFIGLVRFAAECKLTLDDAAWRTAEQCVWEAIRA
jgi:AcrR family transcriptional regulator